MFGEKSNLDELFEEDIVETSTTKIADKTAKQNALKASVIVGDSDIFPKVVSEYNSLNYSPTVEDVTSNENKGYGNAVERALLASPEDAENTLKSYSEIKGDNGSQALNRAYAKKVAKPVEGYVTTREPIDDYLAWSEAKDAKKIAFEMAVGKENLDADMNDMGEAGAFFASALAPGSEIFHNIVISDFYKGMEEEGLDPSVLQQALTGESNKALFDWLESSETPEEYERRILKFGDFFGEFEALFDSSLMKKARIQDMLYGQSDTEVLVDNIFSALDILGVALGARYLKNSVKLSMLKETIDPVSQNSINSDVNKNLDRETQNTIAQNGDEEAAKNYSGTSIGGMTQNSSFPNVGKGDEKELEGASDAVIAKHEELKRESLDLFTDIEGSGFALTDAEKNLEKQRIADKLYGLKGVQLEGGMSSFANKESGAGFTVSARLRDGEGNDFKTVNDAIEETQNAYAGFGVGKNDVEVFQKDTVKGTYVKLNLDEIPENLKDVDGQFMTSVKFDYDYLGTDVKGFDSTDFKISDSDRVNKVLQKIRFAFGPEHKYSKLLVSVGNVMEDSIGRIEKKSLEMIERDFLKAKGINKDKVMAVIQESANKERKMSAREMKSGEFGLTDKEIQAVFANYRFWDNIHHIDNATAVKKLRHQGAHRLDHTYSDGKKDILFYKPETINQGGNFFNPNSGRVEKLSDSQIDKMLENGYETGTLFKQRNIGGDVTDKVIFKPSKATQRRAVVDSDVVVPYRAGYFRRNYQADYFVTRMEVGSDGSRSFSTVASGDNSREVENYVKKQNANPNRAENVTYFPRNSNELNNSMRTDRVAEDDGFFSRSIEMHRGELLEQAEDISDLSKASKAKIDNPVEAIGKAAVSTARTSSFADGIAIQKKRWVKAYGAYSGHKFPKSKADIKPKRTDKGGIVSETSEDYRQAREAYDFITVTEASIENSKAIALWRQGFHKVGENLESIKLDRTGALAKAIRDNDPISAFRTVAFSLFIAAAPDRQIVLQTAQLSQVYMFSKRYVVTPWRLASDMFNLVLLLRLKEGTKEYKSALDGVRKSTGDKDFEVLVEAYRRSGLQDSVSRNSINEGLVGNLSSPEIKTTSLGKATNLIGRGITLPYRAAKRAGFEQGERNNLGGTFLVAARKYLEENPNKKSFSDLTRKEWDEIKDSTRRLTYNMNNTGKFFYQRGLLSLPTQFLQVIHKAVLLQVHGSGVLSRTDRLKLFASNLALFGPSGFGLGALFDSLYTGDEEVDEVVGAIQNGFLEHSVNALANTIENSDKETDISIATTFSPMSGFSGVATDMMTAVLSGSFTADSIPFVAGYGSLGTAVSNSYGVLTEPYGESMSGGEKASKIAQHILSATSGYSNQMKAKAAFVSGELINNQNKVIGEATIAEGIAKSFGLRTQQEELYWKTVIDDSERRKNLQEDGKNFARRWMASLDSALNNKDPEKYAEFLDHAKAVIEVLPEEDREYFYSGLKSEYKNGESYSHAIVSNLFQHINKKSLPPQELRAILNKVRPKLGEEEYGQLNDSINYLEENKQE